MKYYVIVSGYKLGEYLSLERAKERLEEAKHSYLAMVHPIDCFYIKTVPITNKQER